MTSKCVVKTKDELARIGGLLPQKQMESDTREMSILSIIKYFHPRPEEYKSAGFTAQQIEVREKNCSIFIPPHQRFFVWSLEKQEILIDSILRNYPIPGIMLSKSEERGVVYQEDGQQRFTTLWRYCNNLFPVYYGNAKIYYNKDVSKIENAYSLAHNYPDQKMRIDTYKFHITEVEFYGDKDNITAEYFERLNSGKSLSDGDKLWNRRNSPLVKTAIKIASDKRVRDDMVKILGIDLSEIEHKTRTHLRCLCGLIASLSKPIDYGQIDTWGDDVLTESYTKLSINLDLKVNKEWCVTSIKTLLDSFKKCKHKGSKHLSNNTPKTNRAFTRHFGVMILDWRLRVMKNTTGVNIPEYGFLSKQLINRFSTYWSKIINVIRTDPFKFNKDNRHFINEMFVGGDLPNRNANIGKRVLSRRNALIAAAKKRGIIY
jgi:hypothetical protein